MNKALNIHRIIIKPSRGKNMSNRHTSRGPVFDASYEGNLIVRNSTEPGLDSARVVKAMGLTGLLEVWDEVLPYWRFRLEIDKAAGLTIQEGEARPIYRKFKSFAGHEIVEGVWGETSRTIAPIPNKPSAVVPPNPDGHAYLDLPFAASERNTAVAEYGATVKSIHVNPSVRQKRTK